MMIASAHKTLQGATVRGTTVEGNNVVEGVVLSFCIVKDEVTIRPLASPHEGNHAVVIRRDDTLCLLCSACHTEGDEVKSKSKRDSALQVCSRCKVTAYCSRSCQMTHWKEGGHKKACKKLAAKRLGAYQQQGHPSWQKLTVEQQRELREHHLQSPEATPWPVVGETKAMLQRPTPSFLTVHPNMRFQVRIGTLPSYKKFGRTFPPGQKIGLLHEDYLFLGEKKGKARFTGDPAKDGLTNDAYRRRVPMHGPIWTQFAVVGECTWTDRCKIDMDAFHAANPGKMFAWPGGEVVPICPGTGQRVEADGKTVHLLVAGEMEGSIMTTKRGKGALHKLYRIIPRVLTMEGYEKIMGGEGEHRGVTVKVGRGGATPAERMRIAKESTEEQHVPFYPLLVQQMCGAGAARASLRWERFHESGQYLALEKYFEDERKERGLGAWGSLNVQYRGRKTYGDKGVDHEVVD